MPATFVVEDGSGKADANAYSDVAFADQYFLDHGDPLIWRGLTASTISFAAADNSVNDSASRFIAMGFRAGMSIAVAGGANDAVVAKVATVAAGKMTLLGASVSDESVGTEITIAPDKEEALRQGTRFLDLEFDWQSVRSTSGQALDHPRLHLCRDRDYVPSNQVAIEVKYAQCEAALRFVQTGELMPTIETPGDVKRRREKFDVFEEDVEYVGGQSQVPWLRKIEALVAPFVSSSFLVERA